MGRAERRRAQKCEQKAKTATYNLTRAQLDALVRERYLVNWIELSRRLQMMLSIRR